ncbi:MAG: O-antigen ligase family protein [Terricaulis sp.]|nr:O-antigen ligase family protein [Terricaulis sp.]
MLAGLLAIEAIWDMPLNRAANPDVEHTWQLTGNPGRGAAVLAVLVWAGAAWLWIEKHRAIAIIALIGAGALSSQFGQAANLAAFAAGAAAFALGLASPRVAIIAMGAALAGWLVLAPFATPALLGLADPDALPYSWAARIEIWRYVSAGILEQPWIGHGLDASRVDEGVIVVQGQSVSAIPLHPHSGSLQIWFETGAVGAILAAAGVLAGALALAKALRATPPAAAAAAATIAAIGVIANVSFGIWQEWWNAAMLIAAAFVAALASFYARGR